MRTFESDPRPYELCVPAHNLRIADRVFADDAWWIVFGLVMSEAEFDARRAFVPTGTADVPLRDLLSVRGRAVTDVHDMSMATITEALRAGCLVLDVRRSAGGGSHVLVAFPFDVVAVRPPTAF